MSKPESADREREAAKAHSTRVLRSPRVSRLVLAATGLAVFGSIMAVPSAAWAVPVPWKNCGTAGDAINIQRFDASVWPPQAGELLTLSFTWNLGETLAKGLREQLTTTCPSGRVSETGVHFQSPVAVLLGDALLGHVPASRPMPLPIPPGPYSQSLTLRVPLSAVPTLGVHLSGFDVTGRQVVCMQLVVPVKLPYGS